MTFGERLARAVQAFVETRALYTATDTEKDVLVNSPDGWEVEQPWRWWDGLPNSEGPILGNPPPGADMPWARKALPAMARCRALIADALAGVPWHVRRGDAVLPTPDWIADPQGLRSDLRISSSVLDVRLSAVEFWSALIVSAIELGEGMIYVPARASDGSPVPPLFLLDPKDVHVENGRWTVHRQGLEPVILDPDELIVVRNRTWPGTRRGKGIWSQFADSIGFGKSITDYAGGNLNRGVPGGYLKVNMPDLSPAEAQSLQDRWMSAHGGTRRRIAVLNSVTEFHPLEFDPQALQLVEMMRLSAWDIALIYGVPAYKLGVSMGSSQTYANVESQQIDYVTDALLPWARRIESALDARFPRGTDLKLNLDGLRRADTVSRYNAHKIGLDSGFLTEEEVRRMEDLPPLEGEPRERPRLAVVEDQDQERQGA